MTWEEFKEKYPEVIKAMELFRITEQEYIKALQAQQSVKVYTSDSTARQQ